MWRHYKLLPPAEEFTDALDRRLSLRTVRAAIRCVQQMGGAAMAYGAVYGAEPEFANAHPELVLYDAEGKPISLAELFYIMNIAPGSPWVDLIVREFAATVREMAFDGIHLDQYGFPKTAYSATGALVDLSICFPPLIDQSRAAVVAERASAGVIFNAVENWPIETVAASGEDAVYIEVWPPYTTYNHLRSLISEGKRLGKGKQVILAAYISPFLEATDETVEQAEAAALLATAVISASGGSHLLLGESDGVLCDPYYPKYATMRPAFARKMKAWYDFIVRYEELMVAPDVVDEAITNYELRITNGLIAAEDYTIPPVELSDEAEPGKLWAIARRKPGYTIVHLVNLTNQVGIEWNALRTPPQPLGSLGLTLSGLPMFKKALLLRPETGKPIPLEWSQQGGLVKVQVPGIEAWAMVVFVS
jgi:dextranase